MKTHERRDANAGDKKSTYRMTPAEKEDFKLKYIVYQVAISDLLSHK